MKASRQPPDFMLDIQTGRTADVYLSCVKPDADVWTIVKCLDSACTAAVGDVRDVEFDVDRVAQTMRGCAGFIAVLNGTSSTSVAQGFSPAIPPSRVAHEIRIAIDLGIPIAMIGTPGSSIEIPPGQLVSHVLTGGATNGGGSAVIEDLLTRLRLAPARHHQYAFFIGRLERDFTHGREAVRAAVEGDVGLPCLWSDDGRHRTTVDSVRENTRLLIKHAEFVIADLTLGVESPERENPSRAHEIGMTIAYDRHLMLCSQEPRRYPYFSIGDMQMSFWTTEAELHALVREWIRRKRHLVGRTVFNHDLGAVFEGYEPNIAKPSFTYDPARRYIGPKTGTLADV